MRLLTSAAFVFLSFLASKAQQTETYYILMQRDSLTQQMIGQFKSYNNLDDGKFLQDDTSTLRKITFLQDTTKVFVVLSWEGPKPSSVPGVYQLNSGNALHKICTASEISAYIEQNQYVEEGLIPDE